MATPHLSRSTKIILIVEFVLLSYMLYVLSRSLYKSYQVDRFIRTVEEENKKLEVANAELVDDYEYYKSDAYREKIAKQNLNLLRPGEELIVLAPETPAVSFETTEMSRANEQYYRRLSNPQKWFLFFFERDRFQL